MAQRSGLEVPIEYQDYANRNEEVRDSDRRQQARRASRPTTTHRLRKLLEELAPTTSN
jgi:hypothetical protein